jgi:hypothetical protein
VYETISIGNADFRKLWKQVSGRTALIELVTEGVAEPTLYIIIRTQRDSLTERFHHIDIQGNSPWSRHWATVAIRVGWRSLTVCARRR